MLPFWFRLSLLALLIGMQAPLTAADRYALLVGANDGGRGRPELRYAGQDAVSIAKVLQNLGQFRGDGVQTLQQPSKQQVLASLDRMAQDLARTPESSEFIFYYSGHADEKGLLLKTERIPYELIREKIKNLPAKLKLLIIDACSSGSLTYAKGGSSQRSFLNTNLQDTKGFAVVTSSSADEASQESERLRSSFFTHYLLSGLRGAADNNSDRLVTLSEAYQFAYRETLQATSKTQFGAQHPSYDFQLKGRGDFILTDLRNQRSAIEFPAEIEGKFYIRALVGHDFFELQKKIGTAEVLALETGSYEIVRHAGAKFFRSFFTLKNNETISLSQINFSPVPAEIVATRGDFEFPQFYRRKFLRFSIFPQQQIWNQKDRDVYEVTLHLSPLIGTVERLSGLGLALLGHVSRDVQGVTGALGFTYNQGAVEGLQASLALNVTEDLYGVQLGLGNYAYKVRGVQLGMINAGGLVNGLQFGLINIAENSQGLQLGLINYAERSRGLSLAPIMLVKNGIILSELWIDNLSIPHIGLRSGTPHYYSTLFVGQNGRTKMLGIGPGLRWPFDDAALNLDLTWSFYRALDPGDTYTSIDGRIIKQPDEITVLQVRRIRAYYERPLADEWFLLAGLSQTIQQFGGPQQARLKYLAPLLLGKSTDSGTDKKQLGFMLGISYSLLANYK